MVGILFFFPDALNVIFDACINLHKSIQLSKALQMAKYWIWWQLLWKALLTFGQPAAAIQIHQNYCSSNYIIQLPSKEFKLSPVVKNLNHLPLGVNSVSIWHGLIECYQIFKSSFVFLERNWKVLNHHSSVSFATIHPPWGLNQNIALDMYHNLLKNT